MPQLDKVAVLDYGYVRLFEYMGSDLSIVRNARVSYNAEWRAGQDEDKDTKLIAYLYKNKHTSPFEAVVFTFEIYCPIFVARQWHRHRTWSYNEVSARYAQLPDVFYVPDPKIIGVQSKDNKQMRVEGDNAADEAFIYALQKHSKEGYTFYKQYLDLGVPRELARCFLSLNIYTHYFGTVDLHNLFHFLRLRLHKHAQYEIREYAKALLSLTKSVVPVASSVFEESLHE